MSETLAIASGKGGVGKTTISVNLALSQSNSGRCLLLDADMGMANAHILLGINPKTSIMFEDMGRNLIPAKDLGMTTVLIKREIPNQDNIFCNTS